MEGRRLRLWPLLVLLGVTRFEDLSFTGVHTVDETQDFHKIFYDGSMMIGLVHCGLFLTPRAKFVVS